MPEIIIPVIGFFVPLAIGLMPLGEYRFAKVCFAISAVSIAFEVLIWINSGSLPAWVKATLGIIACGATFGTYLWSWHWVDRKQVQLQTQPASNQTSLPMVIPTAPAVIEPPADTLRDILSSFTPKKTPSKLITNITLAEIVGFYDGRTSAEAQSMIQPYLGQRFRLTGRVHDVSLEHMPSLSFEMYSFGMLSTDCRFGEEWADDLRRLRVGDEVSIEGELKYVNKIGVTLENGRLI